MSKEDDRWLLDAEVKSDIQMVDGRWQVSLIFTDTKNPARILIKKINTFRSKKLAEIAARVMQQTAARDARGTQKKDDDAYGLHDN